MLSICTQIGNCEASEKNKSFKRKEMTENLISAKPVFINLEDDSAAVAALLEIGGYDQVITKDKNL